MKRWVPAVTAAACVLATAGCMGGERLKFGEAVTVNADGGGKIEMTVLGIDKGDPSDLKSLEDASRYANKIPYYLRYAYAKTADGGTSPDGRVIVYAGDEPLTKLNILPSMDFSNPMKPTVHDFDKCDGIDGEEIKKAAPGQRVEGCSIYLGETYLGDPSRVELVSKGFTDPETYATWTP